MPTIELISIDSERFEINQADYDFAIIVEDKLISHRGLFYNFLLKYSGTIIHLGNPDFISDKKGAFFGSDLIDWSDDNNDKFHLLDKYKPTIFKLIRMAFEKSKTDQIIFLTDKQVNDPEPRFKRIDSVDDFIYEHDTNGLDWNTAYLIDFQNIHDSLHSEIDSILWHDWDPIGVNDYGGPDDEYRSYVPEIYKMLIDSKTELEIAKHLDCIVTDRMGLYSNLDKSKRIAKLLIRAKRNHK
ncbi:hypothetical protein ACE01N_19520 [Saccharicrinis sp. FJH2]|uniref:hypothetical protein n=1 Tax=Saccharicrinis sp. FJH65 TaxID=3344659 RepID=UPI0035F3AC05